MGTGVGADEALGPVGRGPTLVVPREGRAVVRTLVPKDKTEGGKPRAMLEQAVPIIMATLMAEMAQEGTVGLVELVPPLLPLHVVRLRHIDRDYSVVVAGEHRSGPGDARVGEEFIRQAVRRIVAFRGQGESEVQEAVEQAALRHFQAVPRCLVTRLAQVGDHPGKPARPAQWLGVRGRHGPVADVFPVVIRAEAVDPPRRLWQGRAPQVAVCRLERPDHLEVRKVRKRVPTAHTPDIFEEE